MKDLIEQLIKHIIPKESLIDLEIDWNMHYKHYNILLTFFVKDGNAYRYCLIMNKDELCDLDETICKLGDIFGFGKPKTDYETYVFMKVIKVGDKNELDKIQHKLVW